MLGWAGHEKVPRAFVVVAGPEKGPRQLWDARASTTRKVTHKASTASMIEFFSSL